MRLFSAIAGQLPAVSTVLYPGSYVDIAASVWFDDVNYVDTDKRAARFFSQSEAVQQLVGRKRAVWNPAASAAAAVSFHHLDYQTDLPVAEEGVDLLVSLYAGFISEHCTRYLAVGGVLLVNPSHGDAAMASIDPRYEFCGAVRSRDGDYSVTTEDLDGYLVPKKPQTITADSLLASGRGIAYTKPAFAYLFTRVR